VKGMQHPFLQQSLGGYRINDASWRVSLVGVKRFEFTSVLFTLLVA